MVYQCFPQDLMRLWWVNVGPSKGVRGHAPPEDFFFYHFKVECINLVHFESKIKRLDLAIGCIDTNSENTKSNIAYI